MLEINNLHVEVENKEILSGIDLKVKAGEMHAIMGLNGSGKSTLSNAITGRENYNVTKGDILFKDASILEMEPNERALAGIFMSFQYPTVIPGVNNTYFLRAAVNAKKKYRGEKEYDAATFLKFVKSKLKELFGTKNINSNTLIIHTNVDKKVQKIVQKTLKHQLENYSK